MNTVKGGRWKPDLPDDPYCRGTGIHPHDRAYEMMERYAAELDAAIEARELRKLEARNATTNLRDLPLRNAVRKD